MSNPFGHFNELVQSNVWLPGLPRPANMTIGDQTVPVAIPYHPEMISWWMVDAASHAHQLTQDQAFTQGIYLHANYGDPVLKFTGGPVLTPQHLGMDFHITHDELYDAIVSMPVVMHAIVDAGWTEAEIVAYVQAEAPGILI